MAFMLWSRTLISLVCLFSVLLIASSNFLCMSLKSFEMLSGLTLGYESMSAIFISSSSSFLFIAVTLCEASICSFSSFAFS